MTTALAHSTFGYEDLARCGQLRRPFGDDARVKVALTNEALCQERQRGRLLREEERARVTALGELHDCSGGQGPGQYLHSRVEGVRVSRGNPNRCAGQRARVSDGIVGGEVRSGGGRTAVGSPRLGVAGPDRWADRGYRRDEVRALLGEQDGPLAPIEMPMVPIRCGGRPKPRRWQSGIIRFDYA